MGDLSPALSTFTVLGASLDLPWHRQEGCLHFYEKQEAKMVPAALCCQFNEEQNLNLAIITILGKNKLLGGVIPG